MKYKHLFFDLDHTLWDFETNSKEVLHELFLAHDLHQNLTEDFELFYEKYSFHNKKLWHRYNHGFIKQDELKWKRMWHTLLEFKKADETLSKTLSNEYLERLPTKKALFPYTLDILLYLKNKNYNLHLITNGFEKTQWSKLENAQIGHFFSSVITSESAMSLKPHKEIFDFALQKSGAILTESIMIGDNLDADIQGGINAGMDTVFVNHLNIQAHIKATYEVFDLKELEDIL